MSTTGRIRNVAFHRGPDVSHTVSLQVQQEAGISDVAFTNPNECSDPKKAKVLESVVTDTIQFADTTGLDSAGAASVELASVLLATPPGTHYLINSLAELGTVAAGVKVVTPSSA